MRSALDIWQNKNKERELLILKEIESEVSKINASFIIFILPQAGKCKIDEMHGDLSNATNSKIIDLNII